MLLKTCIAVILIGCSLMIVYPRTGTVSRSSEDSIREIERKQLETDRKLREQERLRKEGERTVPEGVISPENEDVKFIINEVIIENDSLVRDSDRGGIINPFLNKEIGFNEINVMVAGLTNALIRDGYITARLKVPLEQNLKSGKLVLRVIEGYIEDVEPSEDGSRNRMQVFGAFPFFKNDILNIHDLDYGIEQMNRLRSNNATMKVIPGSKVGYSKIEVENKPDTRFRVDAGGDNLGQKSTGRNRKRFSASIDDLLSINDNMSFDYTSGINRDTDRKYNRSYLGNLSVPFGRWFFSVLYSRSTYMQYIRGLNTEFETSGKEVSEVFSADRMMWRGGYARIKLKGSITRKNKENYLEDAKIGVSSKKLTVVKTGAEFSDFIFGGYFVTDLYYHRGLKQFGAYHDDISKRSDSPHAQFNKYEVFSMWNKMFSLGEQMFGYMVTVNAQYADRTLYSSEKMSIGDASTVRGFREGAAMGDRGCFIKNELSICDFSRFWSVLRGAKFFVGYDFGYVREKAGAESDNGQGKARLSGVACGAGYGSDYFDANLTYGRRLTSPGFARQEKHVIYLTFTANITGTAEYGWSLISGKDGKEESK